MAALNFPSSPSDGDTYTPSGSTITYEYSSSKGSWQGQLSGSAATVVSLSGSTNNQVVTVTGANAITGESTLTYDGTNLDLNADHKKLRLGGGNDIELYTDGSNSYLNNENGNWYIHGSTGSNSQEILIRPKQGEQSIRAISDGAVELYYDNSKKIETAADGVNLAGTNLIFQGSSNRLIKYRSGDNDMIYEFDSGDFMRQDIGNSLSLIHI